MNSSISSGRRGAAWTAACAIGCAALAMAATLPGRTHGLGIITTRVLADFPTLTADRYAWINLTATLVGSLFCLPAGRLLDRWGPRGVGFATVALLGLIVWGMSFARDVGGLSVGIALTRGIGQSMLSVVSLTIIARAFPTRPGTAMGAYAVLLTLLMATGTGLLAHEVKLLGWRDAWGGLGLVLLAVSPLLWLVPTTGPAGSNDPAGERGPTSATLFEALATPCFWVFALAISLFGMVSAGVSLFQQSILAERGLTENVYHTTLIVGLFAGLGANFGGGLLASRLPLQTLLGGALLLLAGSWAAVPLLTTPEHAYAYCVVQGLGGGTLTVLFFTVWVQAFGTRELGRIQAAAQMLTVLASAAGPLLVAQSHRATGSYDSVLRTFACLAVVGAGAAFLTAVPDAVRGDWARSRTTRTTRNPAPLTETNG